MERRRTERRRIGGRRKGGELSDFLRRGGGELDRGKGFMLLFDTHMDRIKNVVENL